MPTFKTSGTLRHVDRQTIKRINIPEHLNLHQQGCENHRYGRPVQVYSSYLQHMLDVRIRCGYFYKCPTYGR